MEDERGRSRDKPRINENERRVEVEERKRLIQEADQERKAAILRKNLERDTRADIRKTPHKNASTFVFGSSTPRNMNQELPSLESIGSNSTGRSSNPTPLPSMPVVYRIKQQPPMMDSPGEERHYMRRVRPVSAYACLSAVDQRTLFNHEANAPVVASGKKTSPFSAYFSENTRACLNMTPETNSEQLSNHRSQDHCMSNGVDRVDATGGDNMMSQSSLVFFNQPSSGRKRHPELTPVTPRERGLVTSMSRLNTRDSSSNSSNRRNGSATPSSTATTPICGGGPRRAVSMTRLAELAQPRRRYLEETLKSRKDLPATPSGDQANGGDLMTRSTTDVPSRKTPISGVKHRVHKKKVQESSVSKETAEEKARKETEAQEKAEAEQHEYERKKRQLDERRKKEAKERKRMEEERLQREQDERLAAIQEEERLRREEEEETKRLEEEQLRLAEEHRKAEEEKLRLAIEEQQKKAEEERKRIEEEARLAAEREEQELKAREEAEKARLELEERLRKDEEERLLRKKRVEAIMKRTRKTPGKNGASEDGSVDEEETTTTTNGGSLNNFPTTGEVAS